MHFDAVQMIERLTWLSDKGGPVIIVIAGLSVLALTLFLAKLLHFQRLGMFRLSRADAAIGVWERGEDVAARQAIASLKGCVPVTVAAAMSAGAGGTSDRDRAEAETSRLARSFLARSQSGLRLLDLIATAAPLLGLLGTVLGMIEAFQRIEEQGSRVDPGVLAGGIWEALLTTAAGMVVALIALGASNVLDALIERTRNVLEDRVTRVLTALPAGQDERLEHAASIRGAVA